MKVVDSTGSEQKVIMGIALSGMATSVTASLITSGMIASGQVIGAKLQGGGTLLTSGYFASGSVIGQAGGGTFNIISGSIGTMPNSVFGFSSDIASGGILENNLSSGIINNVHIVDYSGQAGQFVSTSGAITTQAQFNAPFYSGTQINLITAEPISGGKAVNITASGTIRIAMPNAFAVGVSGRMPACGIVMDDVASGRPANVYTHGTFQFTSGLANYGWNGASGEYYSGQLGRTLFVGLSGNIVCFQSGLDDTFVIVDAQRLGVVINSGGFICNVDTNTWSGSFSQGVGQFSNLIL
jgi:hypothetical protein